jgi:S1-C subfamily serine protease
VNFQLMESTALRRAYGLTGDRKGVLVRFVAPTFPAAGVLRPGDIIMKFDGVPVASDGTVPFRSAPATPPPPKKKKRPLFNTINTVPVSQYL